MGKAEKPTSELLAMFCSLNSVVARQVFILLIFFTTYTYVKMLFGIYLIFNNNSWKRMWFLFYFEPYLCVQFSGTEYIHIVVTFSQSCLFQIFTFLNRNSVPIKQWLPILPLPTPGPWHLPVYFLTLNLTILGTSYKWNWVAFVCI